MVRVLQISYPFGGIGGFALPLRNKDSQWIAAAGVIDEAHLGGEDVIGILHVYHVGQEVENMFSV